MCHTRPRDRTLAAWHCRDVLWKCILQTNLVCVPNSPRCAKVRSDQQLPIFSAGIEVVPGIHHPVKESAGIVSVSRFFHFISLHLQEMRD